MANTVIQLKKSATPSAQPDSLANGELAINYADGKLFYKDSTGTIQQISGGGGNNFSTINAAGTLIISDLQNDVLTLLSGNNITITGDAINDTIAISADLTIANNWANNKLPNTTGAVFEGNLNIKTDLSIGNNITNVTSIIFNTSTNRTPTTPGELTWSDDDSTLRFDMDSPSNVIGHIGQDQFYYVKNQTGSTITKGTPVRFAGTLGSSGRLLVAPAIANNSYPSKYVVGVAAATINDGDDGFVLAQGKLRGIDTSAFSEGDILYVSSSTPGAFSNTMPTAPNNKITLAAVVKKDNNQGTIEVRLTLGSKLNEDELVEVETLTNGDIIQYVSANGRFENRQTLVSAFGVANAAYGNANSVAVAANNYAGAMANSGNVFTGLVYTAVNTAFAVINAAYTSSNADFTLTNAAFTQSNTDNIRLSAAYVSANANYVVTNAAFGAANSALAAANQAGVIANAAFAAANAEFTFTNTVYAAINSNFVITNAAFARGNTSAQLAFFRVRANATNLDATSNADTLTVSSSNNIVLIANSTNDSLQITQSPSGVTATTYGGATNIPAITVDAFGRVTSAANVTVSSGGLTIGNETANTSPLYLIFTSNTGGGSISSANVDTTDLYFVPSTGTLSAKVFNSLSDITLKTDIEQINGIELLNKINPVSFKWKNNGIKSYGVIAQELEQEIPELVQTNDGIKSVSYIPIIAMLIDVVKKQQIELEEIKKQLNTR